MALHKGVTDKEFREYMNAAEQLRQTLGKSNSPKKVTAVLKAMNDTGRTSETFVRLHAADPRAFKIPESSYKLAHQTVSDLEKAGNITVFESFRKKY